MSSDSDTMYPCPVGCSKGPFSTDNGAVMHAINMEDREHAEITDKASAYELLDTSNQETAEAQETDTETTHDGQGDNPTFGPGDASEGAELDSQPGQEQSTQQGSDEPTCPACDGELYDFTDYPSGKVREINGHEVMIAGDYQCSSCGEWWVDT